MKSSTIAVLFSVLSAVSAAPTRPAASSLPATFSLTFTAPAEATALQALSPDIIYDPASDFHLYLAAAGDAGSKVPVIFSSSGSSALVARRFLALKNQPSGSSVFLSSAGDAVEGGYTTTGLSSAGGELLWDLGAGAKGLWTACEVAGVWSLGWAVGSQSGRECWGVKVAVKAL